jgi:hypothetical protein
MQAPATGVHCQHGAAYMAACVGEVLLRDLNRLYGLCWSVVTLIAVPPQAHGRTRSEPAALHKIAGGVDQTYSKKSFASSNYVLMHRYPLGDARTAHAQHHSDSCSMLRAGTILDAVLAHT